MTTYHVEFNETQRRILQAAMDRFSAAVKADPEIAKSIQINPGDNWGMLGGPDGQDGMVDEIDLLHGQLIDMPKIEKDDPGEVHGLNC